MQLFVKGTTAILTEFEWHRSFWSHKGSKCSLWAQIYREEKLHGDAILFAPLPWERLG